MASNISNIAPLPKDKVEPSDNMTTIVQGAAKSNSEELRKFHDKEIERLATSAGDGETAQVDFFQLMSTAYVDGNLYHVTPDKNAKGVRPAPKAQHYAEHAYGLWDKYYSKAAMTVESKTTRVSELTSVFRAAHLGRRDIVAAARAAEVTLRDNMKAAHAKDDKAKLYSGSTITAILRAARAQLKYANDHKDPAQKAMPDAEVYKALLPKVTPDMTELDEMLKVIKTLEGMQDNYKEHKEVYQAAIGAMTAVRKELAKLANIAAAKAKADEAAAELAALNAA